MFSSSSKKGDGKAADTDKSYISSPPAISLPKGGGAIKGIGEKFAANPVTGTASLSVPIFTTPSRSDFYPKLFLSYDSGAGNGPFGFGWMLSVPSVTRKTDKGLPRYQDAESSDIFIFSEAEDLVPTLRQDGSREIFDKTTSDGKTYVVQRYRPRVEGLFARIERWQNQADATDVFWKSVSRDNITSLYGKSPNSRISDSNAPWRIFKWLVEESYDDRGNRILYQYKAENLDNVDRSLPQEKNRLISGVVSANRYLKSIQYGNQTPNASDWLFEVVFDYGEHDLENPTHEAVQSWRCRPDAFSSFRSGLEIRTYRLCRRVLMFHCFQEELGIDSYLVRSTDLTHRETPIATYLDAATQTGYVKQQGTDRYLKKSLPPLEFTYTTPQIDETVYSVDAHSLENLPVGLDGTLYQWVDLDSEGLSGILTEQGNAWFYKRNLGNIQLNSGDRSAPPEPAALTTVQFAPVELLATKPSTANLQGGQQLMDLAGDGHLYLVELNKLLSGYYRRSSDGDWENFMPFESSPNVNWNDPNLRFIDLNGDGHADILISFDEVFVWYPSRDKQGFGSSEMVPKGWDEEKGPKLVFADGTQSIYLADMKGDGLIDLVRIRNREVCYWPNLGYGRFGAKVTMDNPPWFDHPELFDQKRIRLGDVDGSGTTDIFYLGQETISIWLNQSGNSLSQPHRLTQFPSTDNLAAVTVVDLLGNGTACIVWSSPLPSYARQPMRYIDLMGGQKPHLLISMKNNLGAETQVQYAASTRFYLEDRVAGTPWITKLPFPVHVVERTETYDHITGNRFVTIYRYHHGYYDGEEREFRGFGFVEQWDTESYPAFQKAGSSNVLEEALHVPPVYTKTWFHSGAYLDRNNISQHFKQEYYREPNKTDQQFEVTLLPDTIVPTGLTIQEEREACRALKGRILRQEIYAVDNSPKSQHPYSVSERDYEIRLVQPVEKNRHAVFYARDRETIDYHYERNPADPRITHQMTLEVDGFGNVLKSAAIAYPRRTPQFPEQEKTLITYTENQVTNRPNEATWYRIGVPIETGTYEITGLTAAVPYTLDFIRNQLQSAAEIPYEATPTPAVVQKRLIERVRTLYRRNDRANTTDLACLPLGQIESLALPCESYKMAFTPGLLTQVYSSWIGSADLNALLRDEGRYVEQDGVWWIPSGRQAFDPDKFYLPTQMKDPFGGIFTTIYDKYSLLVVETRDALPSPQTNVVRISNNYRTLQPEKVTDTNGNRAFVAFNALGMVVGTAVMGKETETKGDSLAEFKANLTEQEINAFFANPLVTAAALLGNATTRIIYDLERFKTSGKPVLAATLARETHVSDRALEEQSKIQVSFSYSDGVGREVQKKIQAEPGLVPMRDTQGVLRCDQNLQHTDPRWVGTGRTVFNNKGKPVKQYEPFFSPIHVYEDEKDLVECGVTPIIHYDPLERVIRTDLPNGTFSKVEFDAWQQKTWDENDTVVESRWYAERQGAAFPGSDPDKVAERRSARITLEAQKIHPTNPKYGTPTVAHLDVLGRTFLTIADNGMAQDGTRLLYRTHVKLDIEGNQREITDARSNRVMVQEFDLLGHVTHSDSMDAGQRWMLNNVAGNPIWMWDSRGYQRRPTYDTLQRPTKLFIQKGTDAEVLAERIAYGETHPNAATLNLRGKAHQQYDGAGVVTHEEYDFKGNLLRSSRQLAQNYKGQIDWSGSPMLETEVFISSTVYDALNRPIRLLTPHTNSIPASEIRPTYNEANLLEKVDVRLREADTWTEFVTDIDYNAKGQRELIEYRIQDASGNPSVVRTTYQYNRETFRLINLKTTRLTDGRLLQNLHYTYAPVGNITKIRDDAQQTIFFKNTVISPNNQYVYDALYRLIRAEGREHIGQVADPQPEYNPTDFPRVNLPHPNDGNAMRCTQTIKS